MGSHLGVLGFMHNEVHLEGLLVSQSGSRWGLLLGMSCPQVRVGAIAGDELHPEPALPWVLARLGQNGVPQYFGLWLQEAYEAVVFISTSSCLSYPETRKTSPSEQREVRQDRRRSGTGTPHKR